MKCIFLSAAAFALIGLVGCNNGTPGGPGADEAKQREKDSKIKQVEDKLRQPEDTFSLTVPTFSTKIKQGETQELVIGIKRGKNFNEDVVLEFDSLPEGVTVSPASPTIKKGDENAKVMVKAKDAAALGDHTIILKGKPSKGKEATHDLKLSVSKK